LIGRRNPSKQVVANLNEVLAKLSTVSGSV